MIGPREMLAAAFAGLVALSIGCGAPEDAGPPTTVESHPALFYDEALMARAVREAEVVRAPDGPVAGAIVPHHLVAGSLIAGFFRGLAQHDRPQTVVLVGPNHDNEGSGRVLTSDLPWATAFGVVEPGIELVRALAVNGLAQIEPAVLTTEHSVAGLMPVIAYYLPEARVVPVIVSAGLSPAEARRLGRALAAVADEATVVVAAVDFSHDLTASEAQHRDTVTLQALHDGDAALLFTLDNAYLDSPASIAVLMAAMEERGAGPFVLLEHTNSGLLAADELLPTTSYITGYYPREGAHWVDGLRQPPGREADRERRAP